MDSGDAPRAAAGGAEAGDGAPDERSGGSAGAEDQGAVEGGDTQAGSDGSAPAALPVNGSVAEDEQARERDADTAEAAVAEPVGRRATAPASAAGSAEADERSRDVSTGEAASEGHRQSAPVPQRRSSLGGLLARLDASLDAFDRRAFHDRQDLAPAGIAEVDAMRVFTAEPEAHAAHPQPPREPPRDMQRPAKEPAQQHGEISQPQASREQRPAWRAWGRGLVSVGRWARQGFDIAKGEIEAARRDFMSAEDDDGGLHAEQLKALRYDFKRCLDEEGIMVDCPPSWWLRAHGFDAAAAAEAAIGADAWRAARRGKADPHAAPLATALSDGRVRWQGHDALERPMLCIRAAMVDEDAGATSTDFAALLHVLESALSFAAPVEGRARAEEEQALAVLRGAGAGAVSAAQTRELARAAGVAMTTRSANGAFTLLYDSSPLPTSAQGQVGSGGTGDADAAVNECASLRLLLNFVDALCRFFPSRLAMLVAMPSAAEASQVCRPVGFC